MLKPCLFIFFLLLGVFKSLLVNHHISLNRLWLIWLRKLYKMCKIHSIGLKFPVSCRNVHTINQVFNYCRFSCIIAMILWRYFPSDFALSGNSFLAPVTICYYLYCESFQQIYFHSNNGFCSKRVYIIMLFSTDPLWETAHTKHILLRMTVANTHSLFML